MQSAELNHQPVSNVIRDNALRQQLLSRRQRLDAALAANQRTTQFVSLLQDIDAALERMEAGTFGICETCHDTIEGDRLLLDPLCRNCLDHLSSAEQRALERDLDLALQVQRGLLPPENLKVDGWSFAYAYRPARAVSGDYCDVIVTEPAAAYFLVGDITGKGVAASLLMANLHAIFRSLAGATGSASELVAKANRIFCQGVGASHFATLVCGRADGQGNVEICNAGHCLPFLVSNGEVRPTPSTGLPIGLFADGEYGSEPLRMGKGDSLVFYSDGLSELFNPAGQLYGAERLMELLRANGDFSPRELLAGIVADADRFRAGGPAGDDLTVMVLRREV